MNDIIGIRGGGDLATGVAWRLHKSGFRVYIMEIENPLMVRRTVCFGQAVLDGETAVEGVSAVLVENADLKSFGELWKNKKIPVIVDPSCESIKIILPTVIVDGILAKKNLGTRMDMAKITIGL